MNLYNLFSKVLVIISLSLFLAIPSVILAAENNYQVFSEIETKKIFQNSIFRIGDKAEKLKASPDANPQETTAMFFIREIVRSDLWNYLFGDLPAETMVTISKELVSLAQILSSENPASGIISLMESQSVKLAVKTANDYLFQQEIKVAYGAMKVKYKIKDGEVDTALQYIIVYKPIDKESGEMIIRIYSPKEIEPPVSHGSAGMAIGFINDMPDGQNIPPFIAEIRGKIKETGFLFDREWTEAPTINILFPKKVPDFNLKPKSWVDKYIYEPISRTVNNFAEVINFFLPKGQLVDYIPYAGDDSPSTEKINNEISKIAVSQPPEEQSNNQTTLKPLKDLNISIVNQPSGATQKDNSLLLTNLSNFGEEERKQDLSRVLEELQKRLNGNTNKTQIESDKKTESPTSTGFCSIDNYSNPKQDEIIINEVAWMGTAASSSDEWIELRNLSSKEINLTGWSLVNKSKKINIVFKETHSIPGNGLFLMERSDDESVPNKKADLIYNGTLSNSNEALYLFNSKCELKDIVKADPSWPAGNSDTKRTMERALNNLVWYTYGGGEDDIMGTPKEVNSNTNWLLPVQNSGSGSSATHTQSSSNNQPSETISFCSQTGLGSPTQSPIVINEIAWMGTAASSSDEWIELKNISTEPVNLNKWQLLDKDEQIKISFTTTDVIEPGEFYLLERTDNNSVPNVSANKIYSGTLSDTNESLRLFNASCVLVDEVTAASNWPAGDKTAKKSMERNTNLTGWHTYSESVADNTSGLFGTPKKENSEFNQAPEDSEEENSSAEEKTSDISTKSISDLTVLPVSGIKNSLTLNWTELPEASDYEIYYSLGGTISENDLHTISEFKYLNIEIFKESGKVRAELKDLYWDNDYYFAVKGKSAENKYSQLSNVVNFKIDKANHELASIYTGIITGNGPTSNEQVLASAFITGFNEQPGDEGLYSSPVIDENGSIYFKGKIDGKSGVYCFDKNGNKKWYFEIAINDTPPVLSADGTLYSFDSGFLYALSPNGKLKWKDGLNNVYTQNIALSKQGAIYILANAESSPILLKIIDNKDGTISKQTVYNLAGSLNDQPIASNSEIIFDSQDNLYFGVNNKLFIFNPSDQKILEKQIDVIFNDDYQEIGSEIAGLKEFHFSGDVLLCNSINGYCQNEGGCRNAIYAFNRNNFDTPLWVKHSGTLLGASSTEAYVKERIPTWTGSYMSLRAFNLLDGAEKWSKASGSASEISLSNFDNRGYLYFSQSGIVYGFDPGQIVDTSWGSGKIFEVYSIYNGNLLPVAIGNGAMYLPKGESIGKIIY